MASVVVSRSSCRHIYLGWTTVDAKESAGVFRRIATVRLNFSSPGISLTRTTNRDMKVARSLRERVASTLPTQMVASKERVRFRLAEREGYKKRRATAGVGCSPLIVALQENYFFNRNGVPGTHSFGIGRRCSSSS